MSDPKQFQDIKVKRLRLFRAELKYLFAKAYFVKKNYGKAKLLFKRPLIQSLSFILRMKKFLAVYNDGRRVSSNNFWKFYTLRAKEFDFSFQDIVIRHAEVGACEEIFAGEYEWLPVEDKVVVDIGASIGDSPIYFAFRGANRVIAIESDNTRFKYLEENVKNSKFINSIELLHVSLVPDGKSFSPTTLEEGMSLKQILDKFSVKDRAVMKIDCEGCEYDTILNAEPTTLLKFSHIIGEYHNDYPYLKDKLESCGFQTRFTKPTFFYDPTNSNPNRLIGDFIAWI